MESVNNEVPIPGPGYSMWHYLPCLDERADINLDTTYIRIRTHEDGCPFQVFFAIFDTNSILNPQDTMPCLPPTGLHLDAADTATATLAWNHQDSTRWLLQVFPADSIPDSTTADTMAVNMIVLTGLDTATTYAARLRTLCHRDSASAWTDTIQFRLLPPADTTHHTDPLALTSPIDSYTHLFPNPATTSITIVSSFHLRKVEVFSADGRPLIAAPAHGISTTVDISSLPPATYIVRITTPSGTTTKRLVKK